MNCSLQLLYCSFQAHLQLPLAHDASTKLLQMKFEKISLPRGSLCAHIVQKLHCLLVMMQKINMKAIRVSNEYVI
jgi:hypothetical protein